MTTEYKFFVAITFEGGSNSFLDINGLGPTLFTLNVVCGPKSAKITETHDPSKLVQLKDKSLNNKFIMPMF